MATSSSPRPAYICGLGAVTGYGWGRKLLWDGLLSGESAVQPTPGYGEFFDSDEIFVARVPEGGERRDGLGRFGRATLAAARESVEDATERGWEPGRVVGVVHALVLGEVDLWRDFYLDHDRRRTRRQFLELMPSTPLSKLTQEHGFRGPCMGVTAMCASGNAALLTAKSWLDAGVATDVVVLATDISATPENVKHFVNLGVAVVDRPAEEASRPFQRGSLGFPVGEAAVSFVVSSRRPGAYLSLRGGAMSHDGHHVVSIAPDHGEILRCFGDALAQADVDAADVRYLNAHGPGTAQCDTAEARVLDELLGHAEGVFSFKPLAGHCQGAASAVEVAASCVSYAEGIIPAPAQVAEGHPRLVAGPTPRREGVTLKSSIGMGGHNSVIVLDEP